MRLVSPPPPSLLVQYCLALPLTVFLVLVITWRFQLLTASDSSSPCLYCLSKFNSTNTGLSLNGSRTNHSSSSPVLASSIQEPKASSSSSIHAPMTNHKAQLVDPGSCRLSPQSRRDERNLEDIESVLARARASIREAALVRNLTSLHQDPDYVPQGPIYRNPNAFHRSYMEMEKAFKVYVYEEGEPPMFRYGPCKNIYASEGRFIHEMLKENQTFRAKHPNKAVAYFLPFSVVEMVEYLHQREARDVGPIGRAVADYVTTVAAKHPFWNRSLGADHFMVSCHDWGPRTSSYVPQLFHRSIRVLCNANTSEGFKPSKDASFPEINLVSGELTGLVGGPSPSRRPILAFFSGRLHGHIRYLLLREWRNRDQDIQVYEELPKGVSYTAMMRQSRFCLCPSGYEVASPRVVEAIYAECVPVLISDAYVAPFSDVLSWKAFSIQVSVKDIPNIKKILTTLPTRQYLRMQRRVKQVQRHFVVNSSPQRFDFFHMTLHSIWLRRLNVQIQI